MPNKLIKANSGDIIFQDQNTSSNSSSLWDVGDVRQSLLTLAEFQARNGSDWVLMDGQDVTGSVYATITGQTTLPDARGQFMRMEGGNAQTLTATRGGTVQADATAKNGLTASASSSSVSGSATSAGSHGHNVSYGTENNAGTGYISILGQEGTAETTNSAGNTIVSGGAHTHPLSGTAAAQTITIGAGDAETRPSNITVNYFVKIN